MIHEVVPEGVEVVSKGGGGAPPSPLGAVIDKRPAPEASCPPAAQAKKTIDLVDPKSASVSAQAKHDCNRELAEGELASSPWGLPARKRQRADKMVFT